MPFSDYRKLAAKSLTEAIGNLCSELNLSEAALTEEQILSLLERPPKDDMGDLAFPCFRLSKVFKKAPPQIAAALLEKIRDSHDLSDDKNFRDIKPLGPYLNFFLNQEKIIDEAIGSALNAQTQNTPFGESDFGSGKRVVIEYSSPNIGKPMHIGHLRVTIVGSALNKIFRHIGYDVVSVNHIGDWGSQFGKLAVAYKLWGNESELEADPFKHLTDIYVKFHGESEKNEDLLKQGADAFKKLEEKDPEITAIWKKFTELSLAEYEKVYKKLGASFDHFLGESFYEDKMQTIIDQLKSKNLLKESDGAQIVDLEEHNLLPAIILKSDGSTIYMTRDLAAAKYRADSWPFDELIYVVGAQQELHFRQLFKILELMEFDWAKKCLHVKTGWYQFQGMSLSTRKGQTLLVSEVLDKAKEKALEVIKEKNPDLENKEEVSEMVSIGATLFADLFTDPQKDVNFDFDRVLDFNGETGAYLQYTYARSNSIIAKVASEHPTSKPEIDAAHLVNDKNAYEIARAISRFEEVLIQVTKDHKPSVLAHYLIDLAGLFNGFYIASRVLGESEIVQNSRLGVVVAVRKVLKEGLDLLGIPTPQKM